MADLVRLLDRLCPAAAAQHDGAAIKREPRLGRIVYSAFLVAGFWLLFRDRALPFLNVQLWPANQTALIIGLSIQVLGLGFAIWARHVLGTNWSGRVATGSNQELIVRGPYRVVRHPIYTGLICGFLGTAVLLGNLRAFAALLLVTTGVLLKLRREESALREHFGEAYAEYAKRVPGLVPRASVPD